jgi:hypothetical protein
VRWVSARLRLASSVSLRSRLLSLALLLAGDGALPLGQGGHGLGQALLEGRLGQLIVIEGYRQVGADICQQIVLAHRLEQFAGELAVGAFAFLMTGLEGRELVLDRVRF